MKTFYKGHSLERNRNGRTELRTYVGSYQEVMEYAESLSLSEEQGGNHISTIRVSQEEGNIWKCEVTYSDESDNGSFSSSPNNKPYGEKTCTLSCGMISCPLETHPLYRMHWNHYLIGCDIVSITSDGKATTLNEINGKPEFWENATYESTLTTEQSYRYRWIKDLSELPQNVANQKLWRVLYSPTKPGVTSYDMATYQITESAKHSSAKSAGNYVCNRLNRIAEPMERFNIKEGNWKVDSASISFSGKYWLSQLTYTRSTDKKGWDKELYS